MNNPLPKLLSAPALVLGSSVFFAPATARADTFKLTTVASGNYTYTGTGSSQSTTIPAGPYNGTWTTSSGVTNLLVYCLDETLTSYWGHSYSGTLDPVSGVNQQEAAWLAAYSLTLGAPSTHSSVINSVEGPISMAIWQLMGTLQSPSHPDPAAAAFVTLAQNAYASGAITAAFLADVRVFNPVPAGTSQRFITATMQNFTNIAPPTSSTPEPETIAMMGGGLLLVVLGRRRR